MCRVVTVTHHSQLSDREPSANHRDNFRFMQIAEINRVVPPANRIILLEPVLDVRLHVLVVIWSYMQSLSGQDLPDFPLVDQYATRLDDCPRQFEHDFL